MRILLEAVTFLGNQEHDRHLDAIPGLDYAAHEDLLPYTVTYLGQGLAPPTLVSKSICTDSHRFHLIYAELVSLDVILSLE